jgi:murein L,D-transpeptidase YcbB/YkuD
VALFQSNNGLQVTGIANKTTLKALNVPINKIIDKISINMDRMRWLPDDIGTSYVWVNIPNFSLNVIESNHDVLSMPIIVGKEGTKSCVLDSNIQYIELNPYWNVPKSIAVKELLPKLRENPYYLHEKGYTAYKYIIRDDTEVDSTDVDWDDVSSTNFNYVFRQKPGKTNALGNIKFIFPNNCGIYLHDTPQRNLFKNQRRAYSHGCIRIGKPIEFAAYLLRNKPKYTVKFIESQIDTGKRKIIPLKDKEAVHIVYLTSWVNESGQLQFRPDIYNIDNPRIQKNK